VGRRRVIELPGIKHRAPIPTAVVIDNVIATSAVFGADASGELPESAADEIANVFANIGAVLNLAGATCADVCGWTCSFASRTCARSSTSIG
jgi:2-iminobutanoate/2-iminopropanoate deaminase